MTRAGVVARSEVDGRTVYSLTDSGKELISVIEALGTWSVRWLGDLVDRDLDPSILMLDIRRTIAVEEWPRTRTVLAFQLAGGAPKASRWWLMVADGEPDVCDFDPGYDVTATISTDVRSLAQIWRGD